MISATPAFNLKVVLKETGIAADTLRAWERRYGLPMPQRSAGGHRLYSQRDIEIIKWLMTRQEEGLSISRAVDLWKEQIASGTDPLASLEPTASTMSIEYQSPDTSLDSLRAHWMEACLNFSETYAEQVLNQAFSLFPVEAVCLDLLQKAMSEIGERWYENRLSVQQEHFASALARRKLDSLLNACPVPTRRQTVLAGCPPEEWHTFTPLLLSLLLRRRGLNVIYLGANVPADQFSNTVKNVKANLVVLVAQQLITAATLQQAALTLSNANIPVAFGGRIFNMQSELPASIQGYFLGHDLLSAPDQIEALLNKNIRLSQPRPASPSHSAAHQEFASKRGQIELTLSEWIERLPSAPNGIQSGLHFLGDNISAALQFGDLSYVSGEVDWLYSLLRYHEAPPQQLLDLMQAYSEAVKKNMNGQGKPIVEWFAAEVEKLKSLQE